MKGYQTLPAERCGNCKHFCQHYTREENGGYHPLWLGHCMYPRLKNRRVEEYCPRWAPAKVEEAQLQEQ